MTEKLAKPTEYYGSCKRNAHRDSTEVTRGFNRGARISRREATRRS